MELNQYTWSRLELKQQVEKDKHGKLLKKIKEKANKIPSKKLTTDQTKNFTMLIKIKVKIGQKTGLS